jgi:tetratricopeptide (TPR) repeat protein
VKNDVAEQNCLPSIVKYQFNSLTLPFITMNNIEMMNKRFWNHVAMVIIGAVALSACTGMTRRERQIEDSIKNRQLDSMVMAGIITKTEQAWGMIDSLETANAVSPQRIQYYRAMAYNKQGDRKKTEEYLVKAMNGDALLKENRELFYQAADLLSSLMINRHENKKALAVATLGFEAAKVDQSVVGRRWVALLLNAMGYCEMQLGHVDAAERCFSQAYIALKQLADGDATYENLMNFARVSRNIMDAYTSTGHYKKAAAWVESAREAIELFVASPDCPSAMRAEYMGGLLVQRAIVLVNTGRRSEAEDAYAEAMHMNYGETGGGVLECATYLKEAERWEDLQKLLPQVDSIYTAWGDAESAQQWRQYENKTNSTI